MFKTRCCGCKGLRSCKICEAEYGAWQISKNVTFNKDYTYLHCPFCNKLWQGWDTDVLNLHPNHIGEPLSFNGVEVIPDFITPEEEAELVKCIDEVPWDLSQSGRYKQNYGPKCNFKKRKVSATNFKGYPQFTRFIQERFQTLDILRSFQTVEQCSLEYTPERGSSIDPHIDDCWIWGERIPTLSLLSDSVLTLTYFREPSTRYNLADSMYYPRVVSNASTVKGFSDIQREYAVMHDKERLDTYQNSSANVKIDPHELEILENVMYKTELGKDGNQGTKIEKNEINGTEIGKNKASETEIGKNKTNGNDIGNGEKQFEMNKTNDTEIENGGTNFRKNILNETAIGNIETSNTEINKLKQNFGAQNIDLSKEIVIRIPMPRRSLIVLYGSARYEYEHSILREDIKSKRVCITYRELTPTFLPFGKESQIGDEITERAKLFWDHKTNIKEEK